MIQFPNNLTSSIPACPLAIYVDIYIDVEASLDMHCHVGSRYGLAEGGGWCNRRKEGDDYFEGLWFLLRRGTRDQVCKVGCRSIVFGADESRERHIVAVLALELGFSTQTTVNLRIIFANG